MELDQISFKGFDKRKELLQKVTRYNSYKPMFYRPDVYFHSIKVFYLLRDTIPAIKTVFNEFDEKKALIMALIHDDSEMVTGDFESGNKVKLSEEEKLKLEDDEKKAIEKLSCVYPERIGGYNYKQLLQEVSRMDTVESQAVKYIDRFDAFCESLHELFAGNMRFVNPVINSYGKIDVPAEYYIKRFNDHKRNYNLLGKLIELNKIPFLERYDDIDIRRIAEGSAPHTKDSLRRKTGMQYYDWWLGVLLRNLGETELKNLYVQKEY